AAVTLGFADKLDAGLRSLPARLSLDEGSSGLFTVRLTTSPTPKDSAGNTDVTVTIAQPAASTGVTIDTDTDTSNSNQNTLTFTGANWHTAQTVYVRTTDDSDYAHARLTLSLSASGGGSGDYDYASVTGSVELSVRDTDDGTASFNPTTLANVIDAEGSAVARSIALSQQPSAAVTVSLSSTNSDVTFSSDSAGNTAITELDFTTSDWNTAQTFYTVLGSDSDKINDSAEVTLSASGGGLSGEAIHYGVTVIDTGRPDIIPSISPVVVNEDGGTVTVGVRLTQKTLFNGSPIRLTNPLLNVTSSDTSVFTVSPRSLEFQNHNNNNKGWDHYQTLTLTPVNDSTFTSAIKNVTINFSSAQSNFANLNYNSTNFPGASIPVQVIDDDPDLILSEASLTVTEGGTGTFTVKLANPPSAQVMVALERTAASSTDVTVTPSLTFTTDNWNMAQTVTVSAADDDDAFADTAMIDLTASGGGYA
ncbi:MAG: hypothetical protein ISN29_00050, partial [Gammaproteobacteria bacterium AqS3]|nr:hypothetical protein [Gammaproteobacteria bacterium AqS3]